MRQKEGGEVQPQTESDPFFLGDVLIITSQKYEVCAWQTLGLQRQTIFCSVKRCYLPSLFAYDLNRGSPIRFMHRHKHPNKRTLSTHTHTQVKDTNLSGERHFVPCPYEHQHSHTYVKTCLSETLAGRCCCCPRENWLQPCRLSTWSHSVQSIRRLCVLLQNDWPLEMPLRLFSVSFLDLLRVFLNFLVDDFYRGEKVSQEQDEKC